MRLERVKKLVYEKEWEASAAVQQLMRPLSHNQIAQLRTFARHCPQQETDLKTKKPALAAHVNSHKSYKKKMNLIHDDGVGLAFALSLHGLCLCCGFIPSSTFPSHFLTLISIISVLPIATPFLPTCCINLQFAGNFALDGGGGGGGCWDLGVDKTCFDDEEMMEGQQNCREQVSREWHCGVELLHGCLQCWAWHYAREVRI